MHGLFLSQNHPSHRFHDTDSPDIPLFAICDRVTLFIKAPLYFLSFSRLRILERCGRWWWPVVRASGQQAHISAVTSRIVGWQLSVIVTGRKCGKASRLSALSTYQPSTSCSLSHATPATSLHTSVPGLT